MKASGIFNHENAFRQNGLDSDGKKFILTEERLKNDSMEEEITLIHCRRQNNDDSFYYKEIIPKRKLVLHYTMGYLRGDIAALTRNRVSVAFVIARNGLVYQLFDPKYWSYHLGPGASGGNTLMSKESIGIELSNIGPLIRKGNQLVTTYSDLDVYCSLDENKYFHYLTQPYRNFSYYATFTEEQYISLRSLLMYLLSTFNIPKNVLPYDRRFDRLGHEQFRSYQGILSHVNCRQDKTDIGPAFVWDKLFEN